MMFGKTITASPEIIRFATVGVLATAIYFLVFNGAVYGFMYSPAAANFAAFSVSLAASYLGHKRVTFRAAGGHLRHLPRFLVITTLLVGFTSALSVIGISWLNMPPFIVAGLVAVVYPASSYALNKFWVFRT
jgi:putative flippase GtrA